MRGVDELRETFTTGDGRRLEIVIPDEATFEAMRDALSDPVWLLGATWDVLTTNDYKRGRFEDALAAWTQRQTAATVTETLTPAGVRVATVE